MRLTNGLTRRQLLFDVLVAALVLVIGLIAQSGVPGSVQTGRESEALHLVLIVLMSVPLALRRVYPTAVLAIVLAAWMTDRAFDYPGSPADFGLAISFYTVGAHLDRRRSLLVGGISSGLVVLWTALGTLVLESVTAVALIYAGITTVTPLLVGREMHERRRRVEELQQRAERAEREREEEARRAVAEERTRIARELHDVVAHQMTVMTLQAEGARRLVDGADPRLVEALETIRVAGRSALAELRRTVSLLRAPEDDLATEPLPRLADLDRLVDQVRAAGIPVDLEVLGEPRAMSEGAELSAYRIVQESLTNAVNHGGPEVSATVSIEYGPEHLEVSISDDGRGSSSTSSSNGGHGIVGMRERIAVLGGEFHAGPRVGGGFVVRASIPLDA